MTSVYAVSQGEYSSFEIVAVFSTEESAKAHADRLRRAGGYNSTSVEVEEWEVDAVREMRPSDIVFNVSFWAYSPTGRLARRQPWQVVSRYDALDLEYPNVERLKLDLGRWDGEDADLTSYWIVSVWAQDRKDALKKGADLITPFLAEAMIESAPIPEQEEGE